MTKRIYYKDSYQLEFTAKVVEQYRKGDYFAVVLDQTAFYPTSGGQMADHGFLDDQSVFDVIEEGEEIAHLISEPFQLEQIKGRVNWQRRFDFMQQHTGFHILAQSFLQVLRVETLSSHLGELRDTIDVDLTHLSWEQAELVEKLANEIVVQNRPVKSFLVTKQELETLSSLRKPPKYFNKPIRIVDIKDFDLDPCGGTHVRATGEVGLIKILSWEKVRSYIRCTFVAGNRALTDYQNRTKITQKMNQILSVTENEIVDQVEFLKQNNKVKDKQIKKFNEQLLQLEVNQLINKGTRKKGNIWIEEIRNFQPKDIRFLAANVSNDVSKVVAFYSEENPSYFVMACNKNVQADFTPIIPELRDLLQAKGGGNATFFELNFCDRSKFQEVFEFLKNHFR